MKLSRINIAKCFKLFQILFAQNHFIDPSLGLFIITKKIKLTSALALFTKPEKVLVSVSPALLRVDIIQCPEPVIDNSTIS